jgi:hypothetical protein
MKGQSEQEDDRQRIQKSQGSPIEIDGEWYIMITEKTIPPYIDDMIPRSIQKTEGIDQKNSPEDSKIIPLEGKDCPQGQRDHPKRKTIIPKLSRRCEGFNKEIQGVDSEGGFSRHFSKRL